RWWSLSPRPVWSTSSGEGNLKALPCFLLSLREVRAPARPLRIFGALARTRRHKFSHDFCNCVRARWRWVSLGRGGRGTSTAAAAHVTGLHSCGVWLRPRPGRGRGKGWGGGDCGAVDVGGLKRKRWLFESASPPPYCLAAVAPGESPRRDAPPGV
uniref:Uncharacterized protein n=1 Tax=Sus scrofa TaxID=9823 RepID=A0A4X1V9Y3_PIG